VEPHGDEGADETATAEKAGTAEEDLGVPTGAAPT
jgi:hypothetical protein